MIKNIRTVIASLLIALGLVALPVAFSDVTYAANRAEVCSGVESIGGGNACNDDTAGNKLGSFIKSIINILLFIIGAVAVIMIIIGGIKYTTSNGDSNQVTSAKNTIMYAIIGLVVALMAFAIVNFVLKNI